MAQPRDQREAAFNLSSPHSSTGGADSYKHEGTPDTRLTAFSPDESSARSNKALKALNIGTSTESRPIHFPVHTGNGYRAGPAPIERDPFVTAGLLRSKTDRKLSPTASSFQPLSSFPLVVRGSASTRTDPNNSSSANFVANSALQHDSLSIELRLSRCLVVESKTQAVTSVEFGAYLSGRLSPHWATFCKGKFQVHDINNKTYVRFTHIKDALMICEALMDRGDVQHLGHHNWDIRYLAPSEFSQIIYQGTRIDSDFEGQVTVIALPQSQFNIGIMEIEARLSLLFSVDDIFAFQPKIESNSVAFRAIIEFCDIDIANAAVMKYNGCVIEDFQVILNPHRPDLAVVLPEMADGLSMVPGVEQFPHVTSMFQDMTMSQKTPQLSNALLPVGRPDSSSAAYSLPQPVTLYHPMMMQGQLPFAAMPYAVDNLGRSSAPSMMNNMPFHGVAYPGPNSGPLVPLHNDFAAHRRYNGLESRRQNATRVNRAPFYNVAGHHNHVDVTRIREGIDVRTTIMLRNIPNKVDQAMLKRIVDESSWGKYDFMYLRIDFANDCNVGYAFINFVDPLDIIDFVNARGNQRWNCFKSDKVAEISYATIQGKDCLVQKFRNSSVMLEAQHYRPKLYHTTNGPTRELAGQEEAFPEPDNHSKMKRSCENAEHVGLFTPNAGQHFRDEQRRRRSQYDRGTRLAALEECDFGFQPSRMYSSP